MKKWIYALFAIGFFAFITTTWADQHNNDVAKTTIENWFSAMKNGDLNKAASYLSPKFVSIHTDGIVRDKTQEMNLIKNLHMKDYHLTNFKFSQNGDVLVVTYKDAGAERIDNKPIAPDAAGRMAVLQKQGDQWLIIAYANMDKIS